MAKFSIAGREADPQAYVPNMTEPGRPSSTEQLMAIASLSDALDKRGLEFWLFGGWAVDFCVGAITREHDDVDVVAWRDDYDEIKAALEDAGWRHAPVADEVVGTRYRQHSTEVEFTFVMTDDKGRIVVPVPQGPIVWSTEPFGEERRQLRGVSTHTIPLGLLREGKSVPREGAAEQAKDRADLEALNTIER
jgi:hypothetical protein